VLVSGDDDHGVDVVLDRGAVTCEVAPRRGRPPFVVDAGDVRVRVVGTRFTVTRDTLATSVAVDHGVVEVIEGGKVTTLHDGERWPQLGRTVSDPGARALEPGPVDPVVPAASIGRGPSSLPAPDARPATSADPAPPVRSHQAPLQGSASGPVPGRSIPQDVGSSRDEATATATPGASPSAQEEYEAAARIEKVRPDDAAVTYRRLAAGSTAWAPSALFALARLDADRGEHQEAARLLRDYLSRYPRGINADDARALLQRMQ
jgi:FecR protein